MKPVIRRIDAIRAGEPVEVEGRVVTPVARRSGWMVGTPRWAVFRVATTPRSVSVEDRERLTTTVVRIPDRQRQVTLAVWVVAALFVVLLWRRSR